MNRPMSGCASGAPSPQAATGLAPCDLAENNDAQCAREAKESLIQEDIDDREDGLCWLISTLTDTKLDERVLYRFEYDAEGNRVASVLTYEDEDLSSWDEGDLDEPGNAIAWDDHVNDSESQTSLNALNAAGHVLHAESCDGCSEVYEYYADGRLKSKRVHGDGVSEAILYDEEGWISRYSVEAQRGNGDPERHQYSFAYKNDPSGWPSEMICTGNDGDSFSYEMEWDENSNLVSLSSWAQTIECTYVLIENPSSGARWRSRLKPHPVTAPSFV